MALIDKETIRAEIERRIESIAKAPSDGGVMDSILGAQAAQLMALIRFIDTLQEQPVEGLEEEISRTYHDGSVADTDDMDHNDYENIARHFYELGLNTRK